MADITTPTVEVKEEPPKRKPNLIQYDKLNDEQVSMAKIVHDKAVEMGVDPDLALAVAWQENHFTHGPESPAGAIGLMQVMPKTAELYKVKKEDLKDINTNVELGLRILKDNIEQHGGNKIAAIIQYNGGSDAVKEFLKAGNDPSKLKEETKNYVEDVYANYPQLIGDVSGNKYDSAFSSIDTEESTPTDTPPPSDVGKAVFDATQKIIRDYPGSLGAGAGTAATQYGMNILREKQAERAERDLRRQERRQAMPQPNLEQQFKATQAQEPNIDRMLQGTIEEGLTGRQRQQAYNDITSSRATMAEQQERVLSDLARKGQIPLDFKARILSQSMPTQATPSGVLYSGQRLNEEQRRLIEEAEKNKSPVERALQGIKQNAGYVGGLPRKIINAPIVRGLGYSPLATGLSTGAMLAHIDEARQRELNGDLLGAAISRYKAISEGVGSIPVTNPFLGGLKALSYPVSMGLNAYDLWRQKQSVIDNRKK